MATTGSKDRSQKVGRRTDMDEPIRTALDREVAVVTLSKPPHNLIDGTLIEGLIAAFEGAKDSGARAILLNSDMKHFCAGADVDGFSDGERRGLPAAEVLDRPSARNIPA
jgi:enoyl-CoA hydratase/carnithine racemase